MKVGIVVPFSWSYIGGVSEHAEAQAEALERLGFETRLIMGDDPPGKISRLFHPDAARLDRRPQRVMSIGSTVTVPANNSRTHIVLSQTAELRLRRLLKRERFDLLHVHEPMTPALCVAALAHTRSPVVGTWHATGELNWMKAGMPFWGMLMKRIDYRIAVSEVARNSAWRYLPAPTRSSPTGSRCLRTPTLGAARTSSSTSAGTTRGRASRCCCGPGRGCGARRAPPCM